MAPANTQSSTPPATTQSRSPDTDDPRTRRDTDNGTTRRSCVQREPRYTRRHCDRRDPDTGHAVHTPDRRSRADTRTRSRPSTWTDDKRRCWGTGWERRRRPPVRSEHLRSRAHRRSGTSPAVDCSKHRRWYMDDWSRRPARSHSEYRRTRADRRRRASDSSCWRSTNRRSYRSQSHHTCCPLARPPAGSDPRQHLVASDSVVRCTAADRRTCSRHGCRPACRVPRAGNDCDGTAHRAAHSACLWNRVDSGTASVLARGWAASTRRRWDKPWNHSVVPTPDSDDRRETGRTDRSRTTHRDAADRYSVTGTDCDRTPLRTGHRPHHSGPPWTQRCSDIGTRHRSRPYISPSSRAAGRDPAHSRSLPRVVCHTAVRRTSWDTDSGSTLRPLDTYRSSDTETSHNAWLAARSDVPGSRADSGSATLTPW